MAEMPVGRAPPIKWTDEEVEFLKKYGPDPSVSWEDIAEVMNRSTHSVRSKVRKLKNKNVFIEWRYDERSAGLSSSTAADKASISKENSNPNSSDNSPDESKKTQAEVSEEKTEGNSDVSMRDDSNSTSVSRGTTSASKIGSSKPTTPTVINGQQIMTATVQHTIPTAPNFPIMPSFLPIPPPLTGSSLTSVRPPTPTMQFPMGPPSVMASILRHRHSVGPSASHQTSPNKAALARLMCRPPGMVGPPTVIPHCQPSSTSVSARTSPSDPRLLARKQQSRRRETTAETESVREGNSDRRILSVNSQNHCNTNGGVSMMREETNSNSNSNTNSKNHSGSINVSRQALTKGGQSRQIMRTESTMRRIKQDRDARKRAESVTAKRVRMKPIDWSHQDPYDLARKMQAYIDELSAKKTKARMIVDACKKRITEIESEQRKSCLDHSSVKKNDVIDEFFY